MTVYKGYMKIVKRNMGLILMYEIGKASCRERGLVTVEV